MEISNEQLLKSCFTIKAKYRIKNGTSYLFKELYLLPEGLLTYQVLLPLLAHSDKKTKTWDVVHDIFKTCFDWVFNFDTYDNEAYRKARDFEVIFNGESFFTFEFFPTNRQYFRHKNAERKVWHQGLLKDIKRNLVEFVTNAITNQFTQ